MRLWRSLITWVLRRSETTAMMDLVYLFTPIVGLAAFVIMIDLLHYVFLTPAPSDSPPSCKCVDRAFGTAAYWTTHVLSILRAPMDIPTYSFKVFMTLCLGISYKTSK